MESKILVLLPVESWSKGRQLMKYNKPMAQILREMNEGSSAFNPTVHDKDLGVVSKDQSLRYKKLSPKDKTIVKDLVSKKVSVEKALRHIRNREIIRYYDMLDKLKKESVTEADLTKKQIKMVHKTADDLPKKDFKDRYGKEKGDAVRYATATNMVKKKLGMKEEEQIDEVFMDAYVITFSYRGDKDRSVVVFKKEHDKDIYVDFIKKKGGKVHSVKKRNLNMKV